MAEGQLAAPGAAGTARHYAQLRQAFSGWHEPIPSLIEAGAAAATPLLCDSSGWGGAGAGYGAAAAAARVAPPRGARLGDARASMPANLAQGGAMAVR
jgi:hypothetical protein|eukprot:COSAG01_NODE_15533_length_1326_cov_2.268134_2_plen_98_part_00